MRISTIIAVCMAFAPGVAVSQEVDFAREVLPILSDTCFQCHGPDENTREADLRLDTPEGILGDARTPGVVIAGKPDDSDLIYRIMVDDPDERMPPDYHPRQLSEEQIDVIVRWVEQGAEWKRHWSYEPIARPRALTSTDLLREYQQGIDEETLSRLSDWSQNPIDSFILRRLLKEKLQPASRADRERLIRRVTFDLTGLPPTLEEIDAFCFDTSPDAYEKLVDRLLASPRYGERMAWDWLDAARYADSNGYQGDNERTMWPWRDWVVDSFNANMPYDEFSLLQIAGDMLPDATDAERLATAFCRNHMINGEGGRIPEENRVEYIFDQLETVGTVWLAMTYQCCRCHDHKYDNLSQQNYYEMFAIFNGTPINGGGGNPQTPPVMSVGSPQQQRAIASRNERIRILKMDRDQRLAALKDQLELWELDQDDTQGSGAWYVAAPSTAAAETQELSVLSDFSILAGGDTNPSNDTYTLTYQDLPETIYGLHLDALQHSSLTGNGLSRADSGNFVLTNLEVFASLPGQNEPVSIAIASGNATFEQGSHKIATSFDESDETGWAVWEGRVVDRAHHAAIQFAEPLELPENASLTIRLEHNSPHINHNLGRFRISFALKPNPQVAAQEIASKIAFRVPREERTAEDWDRIALVQQQSDELLTGIQSELGELEKQVADIRNGFPKVMIMKEQEQPRTTYILDKGLYNQPGEEVVAQLLELYPYDVSNGKVDRLELARWIIDRDNPLTARVTVNRVWQQFFGKGLVRTPEDFGVQGEPPTHPELLDWLAAQFIDSNWDLKQLHKAIVMSATYQQSARVDSETRYRDPENRLLARGPRTRMPSWMLRDAALHASGLWAERMGGASVKPYQPEGVWAEATFGKKRYQQDHGENLYRRSVYTFWRRIVGPTMFFDEAKRQTCSVKPNLTNTPLHALVTLNDITYVEAARVMAQNLLLDKDMERSEAIQIAFRIATSRRPTEQEFDVLQRKLIEFSEHYRNAPEDAAKLVEIGEYPADRSLDINELASWTTFCQMIMNLDETLSK